MGKARAQFFPLLRVRQDVELTKQPLPHFCLIGHARNPVKGNRALLASEPFIEPLESSVKIFAGQLGEHLRQKILNHHQAAHYRMLILRILPGLYQPVHSPRRSGRGPIGENHHCPDHSHLSLQLCGQFIHGCGPVECRQARQKEQHHQVSLPSFQSVRKLHGCFHVLRSQVFDQGPGFGDGAFIKTPFTKDFGNFHQQGLERLAVECGQLGIGRVIDSDVHRALGFLLVSLPTGRSYTGRSRPSGRIWPCALIFPARTQTLAQKVECQGQNKIDADRREQRVFRLQIHECQTGS